MKRLSGLFVLLVALPAWAAPPALTLPKDVAGDVGDFITVQAKTDGKVVQWVVLDPGLKLFPVELLKDSKTAVVSSAVPGKWRLLAYTAAGDEASVPAVCTVTVGKPPPVPPVPPVPPDPGPTPTPVAGLRVLIVYDADKKSSYPAAQQLVFTAKDVRDYLNAKCPPEPDGKMKFWRIWPAGADASAELSDWQKLYARPRITDPWLIVADGGGNVVFEGPLPADVPATLAKLKQYGG